MFFICICGKMGPDAKRLQSLVWQIRATIYNSLNVHVQF